MVDDEAVEVPEAAAFLRDVVNSYEPQVDDETWHTPDTAADWFGRRGFVVGSLDAQDLALLMSLREGLRSMLLENAGHEGDAAAMAAADAVLASVPVRLSVRNGVRWHSVDERPVARAVAGVVDALDRARVDGSWGRLKACARDTCHWAFYDASRNRSGRWCSMAGCGNYVKMRRRASRAIES